MTDDLAQMLADIDSILETDFDTQLAVERDPYGATRAIEAALYTLRDQSARIEDLTAQNLRLSGMCYDLKKEVAISDALLIGEAEASLARLARAEKAEAERDRLREDLEELDFLRHEGGPDSVAALETDRDRLQKALADAGAYIDKGQDKMAFNIIRAALGVSSEHRLVSAAREALAMVKADPVPHSRRSPMEHERDELDARSKEPSIPVNLEDL